MNNPKPEHRISFLEKQFITMGGHLEGIQEDLEKLEEGMLSSFKELGGYFELTEKAIDKRFEEINQRLDRIETAMATKDDITSIKATQEQILKLLQQKGE